MAENHRKPAAFRCISRSDRHDSVSTNSSCIGFVVLDAPTLAKNITSSPGAERASSDLVDMEGRSPTFASVHQRDAKVHYFLATLLSFFACVMTS